MLSEPDRRKYRETFAKISNPEPAMQNLPLLPLQKSQRTLQIKNLLIDEPYVPQNPWTMNSLKPQLPCLNVESSGTYKNNRTAIARHLTNAIKKHSIDARQYFSEKLNNINDI